MVEQFVTVVLMTTQLKLFVVTLVIITPVIILVGQVDLNGRSNTTTMKIRVIFNVVVQTGALVL